MTTNTYNIYLADLTHTGTVISSNIFPLAIGLLGAWLKKNLEADVNIELFKDPAELNERLQKNIPAIVGFSNYSWNEQLSLKFAHRIKTCYPQVVTVFGGPNYGLENEEVHAYWAKDPAVDFYLVKEGEQAFLELTRQLIRFDMNVEALKFSQEVIYNAHYMLTTCMMAMLCKVRYYPESMWIIFHHPILMA